jgi:DNA polymerase III delta subunit
MRARILLDRGESESRIAGILKVPRRYAGDFFSQVAYLDTGKIHSRMQVLLEADLDIKRTKYDVSSILEFAVIRMCLI